MIGTFINNIPCNEHTGGGLPVFGPSYLVMSVTRVHMPIQVEGEALMVRLSYSAARA